jgi:DNA-binding MarR family transcriptional regulator
VPGDDDHLRVRLTEGGQARFGQIRGALEDVTARLFGDLPPEDLATAGRVLAIVTARASAELIRG